MEIHCCRVHRVLVSGVNREAKPILDQATARQGHASCKTTDATQVSTCNTLVHV